MPLPRPDGPPPERGRRARWNDRKRAYVEEVRARTGVELRWRRGRLAATSDGAIMLLGSAENRPGQWWFSFNITDFEEHDPPVLGIVLLALHEGDLLDFGLPRDEVAAMLPGLSRSGDEAKLNLVEAAGAFLVQADGGDRDITARRGDLSWLGVDAARPSAPVAAEAAAVFVTAPADAPGDPDATTRTFFARFVDGRLEPLDPVDLVDGDLLLVRAEPRSAVPSNRVLRRLAAREGPADLPPDLAERHDRYAHGRRLS